MTQVFKGVFMVLMTNEQGYYITDRRNTPRNPACILSVTFENSSGERAERFRICLPKARCELRCNERYDTCCLITCRIGRVCMRGLTWRSCTDLSYNKLQLFLVCRAANHCHCDYQTHQDNTVHSVRR